MASTPTAPESRKIVLVDIPSVHDNLLPMSYTRPVADFLVGIDTLRAKWEHFLPGDYSYLTPSYLGVKFPCEASADERALFVASNVIADAEIARDVAALWEQPDGTLLARYDQNHTPRMVAMVGSRHAVHAMMEGGPVEVTPGRDIRAVNFLYDIFRLNERQIEEDFYRLTDGRDGQSVPRSNTVIGSYEHIFMESGAVVEGAVLNATHGPIYIGRGAEIEEGACLRGPISLGERSVVNMGTRIYPGTSLGPVCKVGGELNNVVIFGYTNKAHDGFLGNSVIGEWCNLGAGCVSSNLKNDYTEIKLWNYPAHRFLRTGLQFCGLIMADHSKAGINTMFNTATVVGVGVNIHGSGFPRNFVASFSEGGASGFNDLPMEKFFDTAQRMMARRHKELTVTDRAIFHAVRDQADQYK